MDLKQLECFVPVAEFGSFAQASRYLHVAQAALSRQVRTHEVELRQTLFRHAGRGVTLAEPGKRLLEHARGTLQQLQRARRPASRAIRVMGCLAVDRVDFALVYGGVSQPGTELSAMRVEPIYQVGARPAAARDGLVGAPASLAQLAAAELVIPPRPHSMRMLIDAALADVGLEARVGLETESVPTLLERVRHDGLHAMLTLNAIRRSGSEDRLPARPIGKPRLSTEAAPLA